MVCTRWSALLVLAVVLFSPLAGCTKIELKEHNYSRTLGKDEATLTRAALRSMKDGDLIQLAADRLTKYFTTFSQENFDRVHVFSSEKSVDVVFNWSYRLVELNSANIFWIILNLVDNTITYGTIAYGTGDVSSAELQFFRPSVQSERILKYISRSVKNNPSIPSIDFKRISPDRDITVIVKKTFYLVEDRSKSLIHRYKVKRHEGEIVDYTVEQIELEKITPENGELLSPPELPTGLTNEDE